MQSGKGNMKEYIGKKDHYGVIVQVMDSKGYRYLEHHKDKLQESITGVEWGYNGGGPRQLGFAILMESTGDEAYSKKRYKKFTVDVIVGLMDDRFTLLDSDVKKWVSENP